MFRIILTIYKFITQSFSVSDCSILEAVPVKNYPELVNWPVASLFVGFL